MEQSQATVLMVDETAETPLFWYAAGKQPESVLEEIVAYHRNHTETMFHVDGDFDGGMFLTEIPQSNLILLEVRFGTQISMGLYSRHEGNLVADSILKALGIISPTLH